MSVSKDESCDPWVAPVVRLEDLSAIHNTDGDFGMGRLLTFGRNNPPKILKAKGSQVILDSAFNLDPVRSGGNWESPVQQGDDGHEES